MRVYYWGTADGMKVLLVHRYTAPGPIMFGSIAEVLAKGSGTMAMVSSVSRFVSMHSDVQTSMNRDFDSLPRNIFRSNDQT